MNNKYIAFEFYHFANIETLAYKITGRCGKSASYHTTVYVEHMHSAKQIKMNAKMNLSNHELIKIRILEMCVGWL